MTIGASLLQKLKNAVPWCADTLVDFYEFTESLPAASVLQWTKAVEKWENDNTEVNPFVPMASHNLFPYKYIVLILYPLAITQHGVQLALAQADAEHLHHEDAVPIHEDIPPSTLITSSFYKAQQ